MNQSEKALANTILTKNQVWRSEEDLKLAEKQLVRLFNNDRVPVKIKVNELDNIDKRQEQYRDLSLIIFDIAQHGTEFIDTNNIPKTRKIINIVFKDMTLSGGTIKANVTPQFIALRDAVQAKNSSKL